VQLSLEYDPAPPFDSGTPEKADSGVLKSFYELAGAGGGDRAARVQAVAKRLSRAKGLNKV
jgi:cyclohexyl-isocyanide hydratase